MHGEVNGQNIGKSSIAGGRGPAGEVGLWFLFSFSPSSVRQFFTPWNHSPPSIDLYGVSVILGVAWIETLYTSPCSLHKLDYNSYRWGLLFLQFPTYHTTRDLTRGSHDDIGNDPGDTYQDESGNHHG